MTWDSALTLFSEDPVAGLGVEDLDVQVLCLGLNVTVGSGSDRHSRQK